MSDLFEPRMPEPPPAPEQLAPIVPAPPVVPPPPAPEPPTAPGPLARLIAIVISAGLAWAIVVAIAAWLIGLLLTRG